MKKVAAPERCAECREEMDQIKAITCDVCDLTFCEKCIDKHLDQCE